MTDDELIEQCREAIRHFDAFTASATAISAEEAAQRIRGAVHQYDQDFADDLVSDCLRTKSHQS